MFRIVRRCIFFFSFNGLILCTSYDAGAHNPGQVVHVMHSLQSPDLESRLHDSVASHKRHNTLASFLVALGRAPPLQHSLGTNGPFFRSRGHIVTRRQSRKVGSIPVEMARQSQMFMFGEDGRAEVSLWRNKRVLLVGASSGLGEALALELSSRGAKLALAARRADRLASLSQKCAAIEGASEPSVLIMDTTSTSAVLAAKVAEAVSLLDGPIDILCYTAGMGQRTTAIETSIEDRKQLMATNFEGAVELAQAVLPSMVDRRKGNIVVVSSVQGFFGQPGRSSYAASKAAMIGYFDALRAELSQYNVRVCVVAPGYIATDHASSAVGSNDVADDVPKKGMLPATLAVQIADAIEQNKEQIVVTQFDGRLAMLLRALWPSALFKIMEGKARKS